MTIREKLEDDEEKVLSPFAQKSRASRGRVRPEPLDPVRPIFQQVRDGILKHSKGKGHIISDNPNLMAMTLEGQIVRISDIVAYVNHDLDDAVRGRVVDPASVPRSILDVLGHSHGERIALMVGDMVSASRLEEKRQIRMTDEVLDALIALRDFLYDTVYERP